MDDGNTDRQLKAIQLYRARLASNASITVFMKLLLGP